MTQILVDIGDIEPPAGTVRAVWRPLLDGEKFLTTLNGGGFITASGDFNSDCRLVFESYRFPEFIKDGWWIVKTRMGSWFTRETEFKTDGGFDWLLEDAICLDSFNWTPPTCTDWRKSKMQKVSGT